MSEPALRILFGGKSGTDDLFRSRLDQIIDMKHELVQLADEIDWTGSSDAIDA